MKKIIPFFILLFALFSCDSKKTEPPVVSKLTENGVFVVNQGNFTYANASLSYYNPSDKTVLQSVFYEVNGVPLGDVAQSVYVQDDKAYLIINNSGFIYVIDRQNGEFKSKITGFQSPRQMLFLNDEKAYVSDLYATFISIVSVAENEIIGKIELGRSSESIVLSHENVFVANWSAYNQVHENNMILVVDPHSDQVIDSVQVGIEPNSMVRDNEENIWVLCSGGYLNTEAPSLWQIHPVSFDVLQSFQFENLQSNPTALSYDAQSSSLFYLDDGVFRINTADVALPSSPFIFEESLNFAALYIYPITGEIYVSDAGNYLSNGSVYRYSTQGEVVDSFASGIMPGFFCVNTWSGN